jgi:hypothetical protein
VLTCADELDEELGAVVVVVVVLEVPVVALVPAEVEVVEVVEGVVTLVFDPVAVDEPMTPTRPTTPTVAISPVPNVARRRRRNAVSRARMACAVSSAWLCGTVAPRSSTKPWCPRRLSPLQERHKER